MEIVRPSVPKNRLDVEFLETFCAARSTSPAVRRQRCTSRPRFGVLLHLSPPWLPPATFSVLPALTYPPPCHVCFMSCKRLPGACSLDGTIPRYGLGWDGTIDASLPGTQDVVLRAPEGPHRQPLQDLRGAGAFGIGPIPTHTEKTCLSVYGSWHGRGAV